MTRRNDGLTKARVARSPGRNVLALPREVQIAFWLLIAVELASLALFLSEFDWASYVDGIQSGYVRTGRDAQPPPNYVAGFAIFGALFWSALFGFGFWVAFLVRRGTRWARVLVTIGAAVGIIGLLPSPDPVGLIQCSVDVAAVTLLWTPPSLVFFTASHAARKAHRASSLV